MTRGLDLILNVLTGRAPPRLAIYAVRNKIDRMLRTGNRRFEFERRYLEFHDPWNYHSSPYEREKYCRTLEAAVKYRRSTASALEVGCSLGVFSKMLAEEFGNITAIDLSMEAIKSAKKYNEHASNIEFIAGDLRFIPLPTKYDVIFCAEVLAYISEADASAVFQQIDNHLADDGIIVIVTLRDKPSYDFYYFDGWEDVFASRLQIISKEIFDDPVRPYEIVVLSRRHADLANPDQPPSSVGAQAFD